MVCCFIRLDAEDVHLVRYVASVEIENNVRQEEEVYEQLSSQHPVHLHTSKVILMSKRLSDMNITSSRTMQRSCIKTRAAL